MLDLEYIKELSEMSKKREAKELLFEYAQSFGIQVKKNLQFDEMVASLKEQLESLANEPMPENNTGVSITDLIDAANVVKDEDVFNEGAKEAVVELLIDAVSEQQITVHDVAEEVEKAVVEEEPKQEQAEVLVEQPIEVVESTATLFELPDNYSPSIQMLGGTHNCYVTLPWWIYEWITQNPDWKQKPHAFPHHYGVDTILSLIYYIKRDGFVRIRETKNSRFYILDIAD